MKKACVIFVVCLLASVAMVQMAGAQGGPEWEPPERDPAFEQEIYDRLAAINPDAVPIFQEATRAMDADDLPAAKRGYERVLELAPEFPDALRRLSYVELRLGNVEAAVQCARQAYAAQDSPYNRMALADALLTTEDPDKKAEALDHAWTAAKALPDDDHANLTLLMAGLANEDVSAIRQASTTLVRVLPDLPEGHFFAGLVAAEDGKWEEAERELLRAKQLGMPAEYVQEALDSGIASQARLYRWLRRGAYGVAGWLAGLAALFLVGTVLSRMTLAAVHRVQSAAEFKIGRAERLVRTIYRVVIAITSLYFYVSIPFLILVVVALTAGIFYFFLRVGRIPLRLAAFIGLTALYTLYAIVRSVFTRVKEAEPGRPLPRDEAPGLWALAEEVARRVDTRPIDALYVTPGTEIAVTERGGLFNRLRGAGQRCLILGLGALPGLSQGPFKAILAHEYGHFSNRDTAGGDLALQVQRSIYHMAYRLAVTGQAKWYNPAWLFVNGFNRIFLRVTLGASRLQEILADRYAALAYGVRNFVDGLTHVVRQDLAFNMQVAPEIEEAVEKRRNLHNLYTLPPLTSESLRELDEKVTAVMSRPTSPYDSHPAVRDRLELVQPVQRQYLPFEDSVAQVAARTAQLEVADTGGEWESQEPVSRLLPNLEALQNEMTALVQKNVWERVRLAEAIQA